VIEVGEQLDPIVTIHELAHGWFDDDTSYHRWITEGLAESYANAVVEGNGGTPRQPERPTADTPGSQPLNQWEGFDFSQQQQDTETYGYTASHYVIDALVDEIGTRRMATVLAAIDDGAPVYVDGGSAGPAPVGWRRFLDLLEEVGGSEQATALFEAFVVLPTEVGELEERDGARRRYEELVRRSASWQLPAGVRDGMERWEFADTDELIAAAERALAARDDFAAAAAGVELPAALRTRFEEATAVDALDVIGEEITELDQALDVVLAAEEAAGAERTPLELLAVGDEDFADQLAGAREAITRGDPAGAESLAREVQSSLAVAESVGRERAGELADSGLNRLGLVAAVAATGLVLAGLLSLASQRRRRRRTGSGDVDADLDTSRDAPVHGDVQLGVGNGIELDEDALAGAGLGRVDGGLDATDGDAGEGARPAGVVERRSALGDVGDAVLELSEDVGTVIDAQPVTRTEVLIDPDTHGGTER
jgi:hypothetical protein